jgi:hypothetical protein
MTWTRMTADESTLPPIGVPVILCNRKAGRMYLGERYTIHGFKGSFWGTACDSPRYYQGKWRMDETDLVEKEEVPTHWHPFPSVPEVGE